MSEHRTKYVVAMYGDLNRGERMNIAVLAWDTLLGATAPVTVHVLEDWSRIHAAFPAGGEEQQRLVSVRLEGIETYAEYIQIWTRMGPYTPFEFTEERGSLESPEKTAASMAVYFLRQGQDPLRMEKALISRHF